MKKRYTVPTFETEREEAKWWFGNRKVHEKQLVAAAKAGEAQILTKEKLMKRIAAFPTPQAARTRKVYDNVADIERAVKKP
jgi:hypothetical protein